jgi:hypothetical protein
VIGDPFCEGLTHEIIKLSATTEVDGACGIAGIKAHKSEISSEKSDKPKAFLA